MTALELTDADRDEIAQRNRARPRAGRARPERALRALDALAREARMSAIARQLMPWLVARQPDALNDLFTLRDLMWLGRPKLSRPPTRSLGSRRRRHRWPARDGDAAARAVGGLRRAVRSGTNHDPDARSDVAARRRNGAARAAGAAGAVTARVCASTITGTTCRPALPTTGRG